MNLVSIAQEISTLREKGRYRCLRRVSTPQDAVIALEGRELLNFSSNNYLGLANHPEVVEAFTEYARKYGVGSGASRLIGGNMDVHVELEEALARFKGAEACLTFSSGYLANLGILDTLGSPEATIFSDELNHASIVDGCRLSRARVEVYRHADMGHLEDLLKASQARRKIIVTDGVFSMGGDIAPLPDLTELKEKHGAILVVDDAHATGTLPPQGRGSADYFGLAGEIEIQMGTFSKALGTYGAFMCASHTIVDYFINKCRTFIFNTALPPAIAGATMKSIELLSRHPEWLASLMENEEIFRREMDARGRKIYSQTAIVPIPVGNDEDTMAVSRRLYDRGLFIHGIRPPTVPEGKGRLRLTLMATHTADMVKTAARRIDEALKELEIEPY
ncbi:MAG: 8-amino-7-oxononanoate synthase [Proteobacteria bacterium]|nr:8-amino-7-oxononanoate synthase [Pseudomonadota bacterium]MCG2742236.1 8-amino-7-oxononanoate synthase [Syntrophaceae bacterium]MBU1743691.1 8-amino-7-oxononanoate synthase [Pseudomonadota bacterium]MBU1965563.1 8-amino-7-oxononanoate synthase [Pseudomonadota bacterium]MBU4371399.1 8-amino-7-oxononanoate synthase [Pseudomonadota bacterium]